MFDHYGEGLALKGLMLKILLKNLSFKFIQKPPFAGVVQVVLEFSDGFRVIRPATSSKKETPVQVLSWQFCEFGMEHRRATVFAIRSTFSLATLKCLWKTLRDFLRYSIH